MSCVSFGGEGWLERLRAAAADPRPVAAFLSPEVTDAKVRRVRLLAESHDPKIRESAALSYLAPPDLLTVLAADENPGVRCCVARNEHTPSDVLELLAADADHGVRGWVAANPVVPLTALELLEADAEEMVRSLASWARGWERT